MSGQPAVAAPDVEHGLKVFSDNAIGDRLKDVAAAEPVAHADDRAPAILIVVVVGLEVGHRFSIVVDGDTGQVVEDRWATVLFTSVIAAVLLWWRRRRRGGE
jgi:hypothetical protein